MVGAIYNGHFYFGISTAVVEQAHSVGELILDETCLSIAPYQLNLKHASTIRLRQRNENKRSENDYLIDISITIEISNIGSE